MDYVPIIVSDGPQQVSVFVSQDKYFDDAQFVVTVDGKQLGGVQEVKAVRGKKERQEYIVRGNWGYGTHLLGVRFLNDAWGGTPDKDRNLYFEGWKSKSYIPVNAVMLSTGQRVASIDSGVASPQQTVVGTGPRSMLVNLSEDAYQGDARVTFSVNGVQIGGSYTVYALRNQGRSQDFLLRGNWKTGVNQLNVNFLNDAWGGVPNKDRNLYVNGYNYAGRYHDTRIVQWSNGSTPINFGSGRLGNLDYMGVNLGGVGNFNRDGSLNYQYPGIPKEIDYYASKGMNIIRFPFEWEGVQHQQYGPLDERNMAYIDSIVNYAAAKNVTVIIDVHNFGKAFDKLIGSNEVPNAAFADLWKKLALRYRSSPNVLFGVMNEPYEQSASQWITSANAAIAAIRSTGAKQLILVSGTYWDGAHSWVETDNDTVIGNGVVDPLNNYAFEVHQYLDDTSGQHDWVVSEQIGVERLQSITAWAKQNKRRLFLGEFGVAQNEKSLRAMANMLEYVNNHPDEWMGGAYWSAGPWWGNYMYSIDPDNGQDKPQMRALLEGLNR